jgi:hypothetical protein
MALQLKKAERKKAKLKLGMSAPSGGGKTLGALLIAYGLMKEKYPKLPDAELWAKIAIIDSENGSGELYANTEKAGVPIGEYCAITLTAPFTPEKYIEGIILCFNEGIEVCIIDSTTHLWAGVGGALEKQGDIAKRTGNSYTAWRDVTPSHNRFIDTMLQTDIHIIATMRSKTEYVQEKDQTTGKTTVRKVGLNPIQRDGMEYEFTAFLEIDAEHNAFGSKDRTGLVDQLYFKISPDVGKQFMKWLESGVDASTPSKVVAESNLKVETELTDEQKLVKAKEDIKAFVSELSSKKVSEADIKTAIKSKHTVANYNSIKDIKVANDVLEALKKITIPTESDEIGG